MPSELIANQRARFEIPDDVAYFNCASLAPQLRASRLAAEEALSRTAHPWTIGSGDFFEGAERMRELFARIIHASPECVALVPATSYGIATAANNIEAKPGDRIVLVAEDYPSSVYTWRAFAKRTGAEIVTVANAADVAGAIDERVRVVAVPYVRWTNGELLDLERIGEAARAVNATFVVDATQACGAMPVDVARIRPDFLATSGYKWLLGPFGCGYLYVAERHHGGTPIEQNWIAREGSENFARLVDYRDDYQPGARRFDAGQRANFTLAPMAIAALTQILEWDVERISRTLGALTADIETRAAALGIGVAQPRAPHIVGLQIPGPLQAIATALQQRRVFVGIRGETLRIAPHLFTSPADVERLFDALKTAL